ncbi:MAG: hypothetical protein WA174_06535, partial [Rhodoferax sp.]
MKVSKAIGKMPCLCCGDVLTVKQAETGTVSVSCPDCDFSGYGRAGTTAHRLIMERVTLKATPVAAAVAEVVKPAAPATPAAPPAKPATPAPDKRTAAARPAPAMP